MWMLKKKRESDQRGQAQVEFIVGAGALFFVILWLIQFMLLMYTYVNVAAAAKEGVRYAVVHGGKNASPSGPGSTTAVEKVVTIYANFLDGCSCVTVSYPDTNNNPNSRVHVEIDYPFVKAFNFVWAPPHVKAFAEGRILY